MNKRKIAILALIFTISALVGSQSRNNVKAIKVKPVASPLTRTKYVKSKHKETTTTITTEQLSSIEQLNSSIEKLSKSMPDKKTLRKLGEQALHHLPASVAELSIELGTIKQIIHDNPNDGHIIGKAIAFYRTCSLQVEWSSSIRALCMANLHEVAGASLDSAPVELYRLAKAAVELPET